MYRRNIIIFHLKSNELQRSRRKIFLWFSYNRLTKLLSIQNLIIIFFDYAHIYISFLFLKFRFINLHIVLWKWNLNPSSMIFSSLVPAWHKINFYTILTLKITIIILFYIFLNEHFYTWQGRSTNYKQFTVCYPVITSVYVIVIKLELSNYDYIKIKYHRGTNSRII